MKASSLSPPPPVPPLREIPREIACAADYEALAIRHITAPVYAHIAGGSGDETTLRDNLQAFARWHLQPRLLRDVTAGHTRLTLFGRAFRHPVMLAPVAYQKLVHPAGERETARAAEAADACLVSSTLASCPLEDIARSSSGEKWFQLYFQAHTDATLDLVQRAEAAGYSALVVTVDAPLQSPSRRALRAGFSLPEDVRAENLVAYTPPAQRCLSPDQSVILQGMMGEAPTWADVNWLLRHTRLPVIVKGVLGADDARALRDAGVAGIVVSNHGGRALDGVPPSLGVLPGIRQALGPDYPVLLDGGVRSGRDIFKALALGADAVMIGRLQVFALAVAGALGVAHLLKLLREELEMCMALAGCATLADIDRACVCEAQRC